MLFNVVVVLFFYSKAQIPQTSFPLALQQISKYQPKPKTRVWDYFGHGHLPKRGWVGGVGGGGSGPLSPTSNIYLLSNFLTIANIEHKTSNLIFRLNLLPEFQIDFDRICTFHLPGLHSEWEQLIWRPDSS